MYGLFIYSLKAGVCLAVFYLFFKLLLSRETLHRFNRLLLLSGIALAFALPLCVITVYRELPAMPVAVADAVPAQEFVLPQDAAPVWQPLLGAFFVAGVLGMLLWTSCLLLAVFRIVRSGRRERLADGTVLVRVPQAVAPFSWGRYIVVSETGSADCEREILLHERAHVRLRHSADLLLTDLAGSLQWFNPAMWLLRRELRAIHEYEADRAVLESGVDPRDYQLLLIKKAVGGRWYSVANSFNHSKLKNRITMMLRKKSSRWTGAKALFVLPLTAAALGAFAQTALDGIDPERIASVDIYKDAEHLAPYGERGRSGVAVITTKKEAAAAPAVAIQADRYKEQPDESGVTHATGRITITDTAGISDDCLIFINGKRSTKAKMAKIPAGKIRSMTIYKGGPAVEKFGPDAAAGAIEIKTRKR